MKNKTKTTVNESSLKQPVSAQAVAGQLNRDVRDSILVISVLINAYVFIAWLVIQITNRFDAALISYLQHK